MSSAAASRVGWDLTGQHLANLFSLTQVFPGVTFENDLWPLSVRDAFYSYSLLTTPDAALTTLYFQGHKMFDEKSFSFMDNFITWLAGFTCFQTNKLIQSCVKWFLGEFLFQTKTN